MPILRFPDSQVHIRRDTPTEISVVFRYDQSRRASIIAFYFSPEEARQLSRGLQIVADSAE